MKKLLGLTIALALMAGCSDSSGAAVPVAPTGSRTVTQGGAQDIGYFRSIVEDGDVPRPDTIEPVGFFAEHAVDLPEANCGENVCLHTNLAVAPGIDGESNWTMAFVGLNTPVDPRALERPDTHVVLVVEDTARTALVAGGISAALRDFTSELLAGDRISIVRVDRTVEVLAEGVSPTDASVAEAATHFGGVSDAAALYEGLARSSRIIEDMQASFVGAHRVVLVTSGHADAGVTDAMRIVSLGEALARESVGVSVVGVGADYQPGLAMQISEGGGGSYYFAQTAADLQEIFTLEGRTSLFPLATEFELRVEPARGYRIGRVYGARRAWAEQSAAFLSSPVLMVGNRTGATDVEEGRRGGGGGLFVELIADSELGAEIGPGAAAFTLTAEWTDAQTGEPVTYSTTVENSLAPGENPGGMFPQFADPLRGKPFMMLNMYLALRTTTELYHGGGCGEALGVQPTLEATYEGWQSEYDDPDIDADWMLLQDLSDNVRSQCAGVEPVVTGWGGGCFID